MYQQTNQPYVSPSSFYVLHRAYPHLLTITIRIFQPTPKPNPHVSFHALLLQRVFPVSTILPLRSSSPLFSLLFSLHPFHPSFHPFLSQMIIPIRCFTCGNVLADKELTYHAMVEYYTQLTQTAHATTPPSPNDPPPGATDHPNHTNRATTRTSELPFMDDVRALLDVPEDQMKSVQGKVLDELGVTKMCCRRHLLTGVDVLDDI